jgi:hypothetical protein
MNLGNFPEINSGTTPSIGGQTLDPINSVSHSFRQRYSISINEDIHFNFPQLFIVGILF